PKGTLGTRDEGGAGGRRRRTGERRDTRAGLRDQGQVPEPEGPFFSFQLHGTRYAGASRGGLRTAQRQRGAAFPPSRPSHPPRCLRVGGKPRPRSSSSMTRLWTAISPVNCSRKPACRSPTPPTAATPST